MGSVVVANGLSCSAACGIFLDHRRNPCLLHWQADSYPLHYQGRPLKCLFDQYFFLRFYYIFYNMTDQDRVSREGLSASAFSVCSLL